MAPFERSRRRGLRLLKGLGGVALAAGFVLIILAVRGEFVARRLALVGVRTTGGVVAIVDEGNNREAPRIQFTTATGRTVVYTELPSRSGTAGQVGDTVTVFYDPADPDSAWRDIEEYYAGPIIPGVIGLVLAGFGAIFLFFNPLRAKPTRDAPEPMAQDVPLTVFTETPLPVRLFGKFIACLMIAAGLLGLGAGAYWAVQNHAAIEPLRRAVGTVVEIVKPRPGQVAPRIEFSADTGATVSIIGDPSADDTNVRVIGAYKVGDSVPVLYDAAAPEAAQIDTFTNLYLGPIWIVGIGIFLVGCGWFLFVLQRPRRLARSRTLPTRTRSADEIDGHAPPR